MWSDISIVICRVDLGVTPGSFLDLRLYLGRAPLVRGREQRSCQHPARLPSPSPLPGQSPRPPAPFPLRRVLFTGAGCLELGAQPIEVADQLAAQRPANRPDCRIRTKQFTERGLPIVRLCQMLTHLGRHQIVDSRAVRLGELPYALTAPASSSSTAASRSRMS